MEEGRKFVLKDLESHPYKNANCLSKLFFWWPLSIFLTGIKHELNEEDLEAVLDDYESGMLGDKFETEWNKERMKKKPSLYCVFRRVFGWEVCVLGVMLFVIEILIKLMHPICLARLMKFYEPHQTNISKNEAYLYAGLIVTASFANVLLGHQLMFKNINLGMKMRIASCSIIYRKTLKLSKRALVKTTIGQMVNLLSNDVSRFDNALTHLHNSWLAPLQVIIVMVLMYFMIGPYSLVGIILLVLFIPFQILLGKKSSSYRFRIAGKTDERVRLMNEIICGIQVIKMYSWEKSFAKLVKAARKAEVDIIQSTSYIRGIYFCLTMFMHRTAVFISVLTFVLTHNILTAYYVFVLTSFYNVLRVSLTMHFPIALSSIAEVSVSVKRLEKFLLNEEVNYVDEGYIFKSKGVFMEDVNAKWLSESSDNILTNVDFEVKPQELVTIIGPVGAGKTTLLHIILHELPIFGGTLYVKGSISYASQEPWIFAGSIRQNILFGNRLRLDKYSEVVEVCGLDRDLEQLPYGDRTIVGERGVMLSGGQKARINLARAIYKEADIYLLDDPLSAVDVQVGKHLFENCIKKYLQHKCVILVTHQLQYLKSASRIYLIEDGTVDMFGSYDEMKLSETKFVEILEEEEKEEKYKPPSIRIIDYEKPTEVKEHKTIGSIGTKVYYEYLKSAGGCCIGFYLLSLFCINQGSASLADYFNGFWVNLEQSRTTKPNEIKIWDNFFTTQNCVYVYSGIITFVIIISLLRSLQFMHFCMVSSKKLHDNMFTSIAGATMRFFNTNPSGRILNRFSKDIGAVDEILPMVILDTFQVGFTVLSITIVVAIVNVWTLAVIAVLLILFYCYRRLFLKTSRNVKRMEGITRSPVFTHLASSLQGLTTIRAFKNERILRREFDLLQNIHTSTYYLFTACNRSFGFWLDIHCVIYIAMVTLSFLVMDNESYGGNVGLAITQALALTGMFQWGMRQWTEWENQMTSVERILEYTALPQEPVATQIIPPKFWPETGKIIFRDVYFRYSIEDDYVLKNINFEISPKEKIGIVGRTGAGKSSIISCLFLLAPVEGDIVIDGLITRLIPLEELRPKISIIPQEPVLFSGTLRSNLDPFGEYDDEVLWSALEDVELKPVVEDMPYGLSSIMSEGGINFSVGQRQLICLARAIIRKNKILIMDEATANVDPHTDDLIQATIRRKFDDCTVLTIAHRLNTVMDSDKILVMDDGEVKEFDHPFVLLQNPEGKLYSFVKETGKSMADILMQTASDNYKL